MEVTIADAQARLAQLIEAAALGQEILITSEGKPVARITVPPPQPPKKPVRFDTMRGKIHLKPGWDAPITEEQFFAGDF